MAPPPVLDFSAFHSPSRPQLIQQIRSACEDNGFFQLTNHGISPELQSRIFSACKDFFALPLEEKMKIEIKNHRGYERFGSQMLETGKIDSKEGIKFGEHLEEGDERIGEYNSAPNQYPQSLGDDFKDVLKEYFYAMRSLAIDIMKALALGLDLKESWFDEFIHNPVETLRFIHYPPTMGPDERGIGAHRDFGCVTLLMQDEVGGLQVQNESGEWLDVKPIPGAYVVNLGNLMMRWTNNHYTSNLHRVVNSSPEDRYSIPFFFTGNASYAFGCIPGCEDEGVEYKKILVKDFLREQFDSSYARAAAHTNIAKVSV